jgi:hypothetical protein
MVRDDEIERIAVQEGIVFEEARGWKVESVEEPDLRRMRNHPARLLA